MSYLLRNKNGIPIKKDGYNVLAVDNLEVKIEQLDDKNKTFIAVASTEDEDRDKDIIRQAGWKLTNFRKNPIVPWSHNYWGVPVARSIKTWVDKVGGKLKLLFRPQFDENDEESMKVYGKYKGGFLTSFSVGFRGIEFSYRDEDNKWWGGKEFTKQELLEISCVSIPANPHASTRMSFIDQDDKDPRNLLQLGYSEVFAKTDSGLWYPITDIVLYGEPEEVEIEDGVKAIKCINLENSEKIDDPVGYVFDALLYNAKEANEWIKENAPEKFKTSYFDFKFTKDSFELNLIEEESDIKTFDEFIDLTTKDKDDDFEIEEENNEDEKVYSEEELKDFIIDKSEIDEKPYKNEHACRISDPDKYDSFARKNCDQKHNDKCIDVIYGIKNGKSAIQALRYKTKTWTEDDAKSHCSSRNGTFEAAAKAVKEEDTNQNNLENLMQEVKNIESMLIKFVENTAEILSKLAKKPVEKDEKIDNNVDTIENSLDNSSKDNDFIELDDSLITPDINDKTNNDEEIELDDNLFEESKTEVRNTINNEIVKKFKDKLTEILKSVSGKID